MDPTSLSQNPSVDSILANNSLTPLTNTAIRVKGLFRLLAMVLLFVIAEWNLPAGIRIGSLAQRLMLVELLAIVFFAVRGIYWFLYPSMVGIKPRFRSYRLSFMIYTILFLGVFAPSISITFWDHKISELAGDNSTLIDPLESIESGSADSLIPAKLVQLEEPMRIVRAFQILGKDGLSYALRLFCGDRFLTMVYPVSGSKEGSILVAPNLGLQSCDREYELSDGTNRLSVSSEVGISGKMLVFSVQYEFESYHVNFKAKQFKAFVWSNERKTPELRPVSTVKESGFPVVDVYGYLIGFTDGNGGTNLFVDKDFINEIDEILWKPINKI